MKEISIIPTIAIKYIGLSANSENNKTPSKTENDTKLVEGIIGLKISKDFAFDNGFVLSPQIYASISRDFKGDDNDKKLIIIEGAPNLYTKIQSKSEQFMKHIGIGFGLKKDMMEYGANIDSIFADDYTAFNGSIKLKINL